MAELAGVSVVVKASGVASTLTNEATTELVSDQVYQISSATKRVIDWATAVTVKDDGSTTTDAYTINYLSGTITFDNNDAKGTITVTGKYLPMSTVAYATDSTVEEMCDTVEYSEYGITYKRRKPLFKYASGTLVNFDVTDDFFIPVLNSNTPVVLEWVADTGIEPDRYLAYLTNISDVLPASGMEQRTIGWVSTDSFIKLGV